MKRGPHGTVVMNPRRRRRRRRRASGRSRRRHGRRRLHKRYRARYRRNPGGMLLDLAKQALPVLIGLYGSRLVVSKLGPMIPGVSALGGFAGPALAIGAVVGLNFATKKVGALAKYRNELMLGAGLAALDTLVKAFMPASVQGMIGVGDIYDQAMLGEYVAVGDYLAVGGTPIDDDIAMSDYIQVGAEEELGGVQEELGVEEELGNDMLGGVSQSSLMKQVPGRRFLEPVPSRSFTKEIRNAGAGYDNPAALYQGVFRGGLFG
jgi:hypothetical protein